MPITYHHTAHDGTIEFLSFDGRIITKAEAEASPFDPKDDKELDALKEYIGKRFEAIYDCFINNPQVTEI